MAQICFKEPSKLFFIRLMSASFMAWVFSKINGHGWEMKYWATRWATVKILCPETAANEIWTIQLDHGSLHLPRMLTPQKVTFCCTEYKNGSLWPKINHESGLKWPNVCTGEHQMWPWEHLGAFEVNEVAPNIVPRDCSKWPLRIFCTLLDHYNQGC